MSGRAATEADVGTGDHDVPLSWTNVYVQFSLPEPQRRKLDAFLLEQNVSLGLVFQRALVECLRSAGIDPAHLQRPPDAHADHHDHRAAHD
jgi:hypothetical protein